MKAKILRKKSLMKAITVEREDNFSQLKNQFNKLDIDNDGIITIYDLKFMINKVDPTYVLTVKDNPGLKINSWIYPLPKPCWIKSKFQPNKFVVMYSMPPLYLHKHKLGPPELLRNWSGAQGQIYKHEGVAKRNPLNYFRFDWIFFVGNESVFGWPECGREWPGVALDVVLGVA